MAPISTIFGPNESQRCQLKFEKIWAVEKISARAKTSKNFREKFEKVVPCSVSNEKQNRNGHMNFLIVLFSVSSFKFGETQWLLGDKTLDSYKR